jgi:DNA invertase Pin-like site-specific DNA recombinase
MIIGYGRVSTTDQDFSIQEEALLAAGCDVVRCEKKSCHQRFEFHLKSAD